MNLLKTSKPTVGNDNGDFRINRQSCSLLTLFGIKFMATREEFLGLVWNDINLAMQEHWIDNVVRTAEKDPNAPFADLGPALKRLLASGASRRDLSLLARHAAYEEAFTVLSLLSDPAVDDNDIEGLHESILSADPSGKEGRPGSAPQKE
jgi:hypothetical protein